MQVGARNSTNFSPRKKIEMQKPTLKKLQRQVTLQMYKEKISRTLASLKKIVRKKQTKMKGIKLWHYQKR